MSQKETLHIYCRCSTKRQSDNSLERQKQKGIAFAKSQGMKYKLYVDGGMSRFGGLQNRPKISELLSEVDLGNVKHIWCEDWSRLTGEVGDTVEIETQMYLKDVTIYEGLYGNKPYDIDSTSTKIINVVKTLVGKDGKHGELKKSIETKIERFKQGYNVTAIPYGFKSKNKKLKIHKKKSKIVKKIFQWYGVDNLSRRQIVENLRMEGIPSPKGGKHWSEVYITKTLLVNEAYIGIRVYTDKCQTDPHRNPYDKALAKIKHPFEDPTKWEVLTQSCPRIIDDELFAKVQKKLSKRKSRPTKRNYLLHGKLRCECGNDWSGRWYHKYDKPFYHCKNNERRYYRNDPLRKHLYKADCNKPKRVNGEILDDYVWNNLIKTISDSSFLKERVKQEVLGEKYGISKSRRSNNKEIKKLKKEIKAFKKSRTQLIQDKYMLQMDELDFKKLLGGIDLEISQKQRTLEDCDRKNQYMDKRTEWIDWLKCYDEQIDSWAKVVTMKEKRRTIDFFIDTITMGYNHETKQHKIDIHYKYPMVGDGLIYKGSSLSWDKWGKGYKIKKGETIFSLSSSNFFLTQQNYQTLLNGGIGSFDSSIPFLSFHFISETHKLNNSPYYRPISSDRAKLHRKIMSLHNEGWGYTKIHKYLKSNNYKIGNSRTTVDSIIKKKLERDRFFNQPITEDYQGFDIHFQNIMESSR